MSDKLLRLLDKLRGSIGTKTFNLILAIIAIILTSLVATWGGAHLPAIFSLFSAAVNNISLFLLVLTTFQYFYGGEKLNVMKKIFDDGNVAAAIYMGFVALAFAILIGQAIV